jgi:hypothetical protein
VTYPNHTKYEDDEVVPYLVFGQDVGHVLAFDGQGGVLTLGI